MLNLFKNPLVKKIKKELSEKEIIDKRNIYIRNNRRTSKSMLGGNNFHYNDSLKVTGLNSRNQLSFRTHSMKRASENEKKRKKLEPDTICLKKRYHIKKEVGRGKQGVVYSAVDSVNNRKVAIKIITDDEDERERFKVEVKILEEVGKLSPDK